MFLKCYQLHHSLSASFRRAKSEWARFNGGKVSCFVFYKQIIIFFFSQLMIKGTLKSGQSLYIKTVVVMVSSTDSLLILYDHVSGMHLLHSKQYASTWHRKLGTRTPMKWSMLTKTRNRKSQIASQKREYAVMSIEYEVLFSNQ